MSSRSTIENDFYILVETGGLEAHQSLIHHMRVLVHEYTVTSVHSSQSREDVKVAAIYRLAVVYNIFYIVLLANINTMNTDKSCVNVFLQ